MLLNNWCLNNSVCFQLQLIPRQTDQRNKQVQRSAADVALWFLINTNITVCMCVYKREIERECVCVCVTAHLPQIRQRSEQLTADWLFSELHLTTVSMWAQSPGSRLWGRSEWTIMVRMSRRRKERQTQRERDTKTVWVSVQSRLRCLMRSEREWWRRTNTNWAQRLKTTEEGSLFCITATGLKTTEALESTHLKG